MADLWKKAENFMCNRSKLLAIVGLSSFTGFYFIRKYEMRNERINIKGKITVVTGAGSVIGQTVVQELVRKEAVVIAW
jgi:NADPH-dependent curcumin reductase CurA